MCYLALTQLYTWDNQLTTRKGLLQLMVPKDFSPWSLDPDGWACGGTDITVGMHGTRVLSLWQLGSREEEGQGPNIPFQLLLYNSLLCDRNIPSCGKFS